MYAFKRAAICMRMISCHAAARRLQSHLLTRNQRYFTNSTRKMALTPDSINPAILKVKYAVRGELAIKAEEYREKIKHHPNDHGLPFDRVVSSNIGNPQQAGLDQKPLTFGRQVTALLEYPPLMESGKDLFPADVIARAKELHAEIGSMGAYSHSQGVLYIRQNVAKFIEARDGYPANPNHIFLTGGASAGVSLTLNMLVANHSSGILIPIPQYPLYTATLAAVQGVPIPYYLDETQGWSTEASEVEKAVIKAQNEGIQPKALVIINPGNPTGALLSRETMAKILEICERHHLVLLADEVYQSNLHDAQKYPFTSFKKVLRETNSSVPLISFHSISKGVTGECGRRGGYFECANVSEDVIALMYKMVSVGLCPPLAGQVGMDCLVRPPQPGTESYPLWKEETDAIHVALASRSKLMAERLDALPGVSCSPAQGALYLFPRLLLPPAAIAAAKEAGKSPDGFYTLALLDETGICAVPGDGFGQKDGEAHLRLTCLCAGVEEYIGKLEKFQRGFWEKYGGKESS